MALDLHSARFYGILDAAYVSMEQWIDKCRALLNGGADLVQLRAKNKTHKERIELLELILPLFKNKMDALIINDDINLVLQYPSVGLHIGPQDIPPLEARKLMGSDRLLGLSSHSLEQANNAAGLIKIINYFCIGPVFATKTKPEYTPVGLDLLSAVADIKTELPLFCIGGITRLNAEKVKNAGAERVVAISDVLCDDDTASAVREFRGLFE